MKNSLLFEYEKKKKKKKNALQGTLPLSCNVMYLREGRAVKGKRFQERGDEDEQEAEGVAGDIPTLEGDVRQCSGEEGEGSIWGEICVGREAVAGAEEELAMKRLRIAFVSIPMGYSFWRCLWYADWKGNAKTFDICLN